MNSFAIFRALLVYIQGESHPLYIAERQLAPPPGASVVNPRMGAGCFIFGLLILFALSTVASITGRFAPPGSIQALTLPALLIGWLISMGWTVPLAMFAGYAISRERATHTWDMLRVSPYTTEVILLTKAAASIRGVWGAAVSIVMAVTLVRMVVIGALLVMAMLAGQLSVFLLPLLIPAACLLIFIEAIQEIALSVVIGLALGLTDISPRMTTLVGAAGGFLIRMAQLGIVGWLLSHLAAAVSPYVSLTSTAGGASILLPGIPGIVSLILVLLLAVGREGLVRMLFAWTLQRTQEG